MKQKNLDHLYNTLEISSDADKKEIKKAYRKLSKIYHPDAGEGSDEAKFKEINEAYEILLDEEKKEAYLNGEDPFNALDEVRECLINIFETIIHSTVFVADHQDLFKLMDAECNSREQKVHKLIEVNECQIQQFDAIIDRIEKGDFFKTLLSNEMDRVRDMNKKYNKDIVVLHEVSDKIKEFKYRVDVDDDDELMKFLDMGV